MLHKLFLQNDQSHQYVLTPVSYTHLDVYKRQDYDFAHLLFSDGTVENAISLDNQLNIIQVADLVLPDKDTTFEEYTTIELLSVSIDVYKRQDMWRFLKCWGRKKA